MNSYDYNNVHKKLSSLEDKVNRLEGLIRYGSQDEYYYKKSPSHYKSAVRLSNATQDLKQDLLQNPYHNKIDRDNYRQIYSRVSFLEKELNNVLNYMDLKHTERSNYNYIPDMESSSMNYNKELILQPRGCGTRRSIKQDNSRIKHVSYDKYIEVIPRDTSSSESVEEIIYYIDSSTSSSSTSTSVIIEEYMPKTYTRRSVRRAPIIDVSKSKPKRSVKKSVQKSKASHKRKTPSERAEANYPKIKKSKRDKKTFKAGKSDSASEIHDEESEIYLVKKTKESPKKSKEQDDKEKFFVSRLKKVDSSDEEKFHKEAKTSSSQGKPLENKNDSSKWNTKSKKRNTKQKVVKPDKSYESQTNQTKSKKNNKRRAKENSRSAKQSNETITVARSSFILNDPFLRTIYYDNIDSSEGINKTSFSSNRDTSVYYGVKEKIINTKSESGADNIPQTNVYKASKYEMSNSFYSFDPFFKQKEKFYRTYKLNNHKLSSDVNGNSGENNPTFSNVNRKDIIVLNTNQLKPNQNKFMFKQMNKSRDKDQIISYRPKEKEKHTKNGEKLSSCFDEKRNSKIALSNKPIAHSVYLTTVPVYQPKGLSDFQLSLHPPKNTTNRGELNRPSEENRSLEITSHQKTILEDEILMNVAKKLSPVVAKMINNSFNRIKEESKTDVLSSTKNSNNTNYRNVYLYGKNANEHSEQYLSIKGKKSQDDIGKYISRSTDSQNNTFNEVIYNSSNGNIKKPLPESHVGLYYAAFQNNSPLQQKQKAKKSTLTKLKSITSVKSLFRKQSKGKINSSTDTPQKKSENFIQESQSNIHQHKHGSQINQKHKAARQHPAASEEDEKLAVLLQDFPSIDRAQSPQPKKSILKKEASEKNGKKSSSRFKSILRRITSREKVPKNTSKHEPAVKRSVITRINNDDIISKNLKEESQDTQKQPQVHRWQHLEEQPSLLYRVNTRNQSSKLLKQNQNQQPRKQSQIYSEHDSEEDLINQAKGETAMTNINYQPKQSFQVGELDEPEMIYPFDESEDNLTYAGSQEYLKKIRSISQYAKPMRAEDTLVEVSNARILPRTNQFQPEEIITEETPTRNSLNNKENYAEIFQIGTAENPIQQVSEEPRIDQEVQGKSKNPLQFCIHLSKEKLSKFESQSTSSLDDILLSQCKKVYSTEELSLSEYAFDKNNEPYKIRRIHPKRRKYFKLNQNCSPSRQNLIKFHDSFMKDMHTMSINGCCCKQFNATKSEQLISDGSYSLDWHKVANELK